MYLDKLVLNNFRSFEQAEIPLCKDLTILVGENNGGKSNAIDAIRLLTAPLGGRRELYCETTDIRFGSSERKFELKGTFTELSASQRGRMISAATDVAITSCEFGIRYDETTGRFPIRPQLWAGAQQGNPEPGSHDMIRHVYLQPLRDAKRALASGNPTRIYALLNHFLEGTPPEDIAKALKRGADSEILQKVGGAVEIGLSALTGGVRRQAASLGFAGDEKLIDIARDLRFKLADHGIEPEDLRYSGHGYANLLYMATIAVELEKVNDADLTLFLVEDGRSFEHMAKALGGTFTEFKLSSGISINPFRMIDEHLAREDDDYLVDCLAMLKSIIAQMARNETRLNDTERGLIDQAVNLVWEEHGRDGTVDHLIATLGEAQHPCAYDLATSLLPFAAKGTFGRFFLGDANLDLSADLTVFEISDLATREELRGVVLTSIMFIASQVMRRMDRATPKPLIIDEAWQMLKGGAMADFVETYSRTCRKYGGALITATQSIHDYYKSEGSRAALENSDWFLILQQKGETISDFRNSDRFEMDNLTEALLRSLKRNGTDYSDIFIRGPDTESIGRLVLDRYSAALYSSSPDVFARIEAYIERGLPMHDAIEAVAFPEGYQQAEAAE